MMGLGLRSQLLGQAGFRHAFFMRKGGVSPPPYESLNFSSAGGDEIARVEKNLERAAEDLGMAPERIYYLSQVHGCGVRRLAGDEARGQLLALFDVLDVWFKDDEFGGCMFLNVASEFPNPHDPVHRAAAQHKIANWEMVRDLAARAGDADADAFADLYMIAFEGALVLRQVYGRDDAAARARPLVERLIEERL